MSIKAKVPPTGLCKTCTPIDFGSYYREPAKGVKLRSDKLGTRAAVRQRATQCAFCNLVDTALEKSGGEDSYYVDISLVQCFIGNIPTPASKAPPAKVYCIRIQARTQLVPDMRVGDVQILADDAAKLGISPLFRARVPPQSKFDMAMARRWLDICKKKHGRLCSEPDKAPIPQPVDLLAIDLGSLCIAKMPFGTEFAALSYCWPADPYLTHLSTNSAELFKAGSLKKHWNRLPGTIQDAISCAKELGFRYLWVDALCIIQDSNEHKAQQLQQMDRVYSAAALTLVCAYPVPRGTKDQAKGFPGYGNHRVSRERIVSSVKGMRLMLMSSCTIQILPDTRWDTRCWTYQEHHLSNRLLYFTQSGVYFTCSCNVYSEDIHCEDIPATSYILPGTTLSSAKTRYSQAHGEYSKHEGLRLSRDPAQGIGKMIETYVQALTEYSYRDVSFNSDMLNAFDGIRAVLAQAMRTEFWQGLPELCIDLALCWILRGPFQRRTAKPGVLDPANPLFPSWSWAGWIAPVNLNVFLAMEEYRTEVDWFIVNAQGQAIQLRTCRDAQAVLKYAPKGNKDVAPPKTDVKKLLPKLLAREKVKTSEKIWREAKILACWTTKATFWLDGSFHSLGIHDRVWPASANLAIKDDKGRTVGCILLPWDFAEDCAHQKMKCEFILISRTCRQKFTEFQKALKYFDTKIFEDRDWCTLNVMLATKIAGGKYLRLGVGVVHEDAWVNAKPEGTFVQLI